MSSPARRLWLTAGSILALAIVAYGVLVLVNLLAWTRSTETIRVAGLEGVQRIRIDGDAGGVELTGTDATEVSGRVRLDATLSKPSHEEYVEDGTLVLHSSCPTFNVVMCGVRYELNIPRGMVIEADVSGGGLTIVGVDGAITADSSGGGMELTDVSGALRLASSGGGITVTGASGPVVASSSGGGVRLRDTTSKDVQVDSSGGGVDVAFRTAPDRMRADSSGGGVTVELPQGDIAYRVDSKSSGGSNDVEVRTDPASPHDIYVRSSGGSVRVRYGAAAT